MREPGAIQATTDAVDICVEIPRGSQNKYEYDPVRGRLHLDRVLYSSVHFPAEYGFIEQTLAEDGEALDALVLIEHPTFPGCVVRARPVAALHLLEDGNVDDKILCACVGDPRLDQCVSLETVPAHTLTEIENFFEIYSMLEGRESKLRGWGDRDEALELIRKAQRTYLSGGADSKSPDQK
jgi:inorganic pyrophosphatase